jgi:DNA repair exonuclease SbcCD nuclease subunit
MNSPIVTKINDKTTDQLYVALYHGTLYKSTTNVGWTNDDEHSFKTSDFKDYDIVMLGDIHKFQYLNKEKTIAYPSSLIQQNYGESINYHGMIEWNVKTKKGKFIQVPNNYVYKVHKITDINDYNISEITNKKTRLKLIFNNQKREDVEIYKKQIHKLYNIIHLRQEEIYDEKNSIIKNGQIINKGIVEIYKDYLQEYKIKD